MIERWQKILRLGDKSDPFLFAVNRQSRDYGRVVALSLAKTLESQ